MMRKWLMVGMVVVIVAAACAAVAVHNRAADGRTEVAASAPRPDPGPAAARAYAAASQPAAKGMAAVDRAAKAGRYLFAFLYKDRSAATAIRRDDFDAAVKAIGRKADSVVIDAPIPPRARW